MFCFFKREFEIFFNVIDFFFRFTQKIFEEKMFCFL
jgi:hypothetical protein